MKLAKVVAVQSLMAMIPEEVVGRPRLLRQVNHRPRILMDVPFIGVQNVSTGPPPTVRALMSPRMQVCHEVVMVVVQQLTPWPLICQLGWLWHHLRLLITLQLSYTPVVQWSTVRLLLTMILSKNWVTKQVDYTNTFALTTLNEQVYIDSPQGFTRKDKANKVLHLIKSSMLMILSLQVLMQTKLRN